MRPMIAQERAGRERHGMTAPGRRLSDLQVVEREGLKALEVGIALASQGSGLRAQGSGLCGAGRVWEVYLRVERGLGLSCATDWTRSFGTESKTERASGAGVDAVEQTLMKLCFV
eukprot:1785175-Rhodomonas_salina.2